MTGDGLKLFEYNEANQLKLVKLASNSATIAEYIYDYKGNRMVKKNYVNGSLHNTVYSWSDSFETKVIEGGATETTVYYFANKELIAKKKPDGSMNYIHTDHLGSTSVVTNLAGELVESTSYDPWGEVLAGGTQSKFGYTGQEHDSETGLKYYNARYYDSDIRRFTQPDNIIQNIYDPQSLNRYSYVRNNPLRYTDPTGNCWGDLFKSVCGAVAGFFNSGSKNAPPTSTLSSKEIQKSLPKNTQTPIKGLSGGNGNNNNSGTGNTVYSTSIQSNQPVHVPNNAPPKSSVSNNMKEASQHKLDPVWFYSKVNGGEVWDYKDTKRYGSNAGQYENFGNFNYGAVGKSAGYSEWFLLNAAGVVQIRDNNEKKSRGESLAPSEGIPGLIYPYGDDPVDSYWIQQGYRYTENL